MSPHLTQWGSWPSVSRHKGLKIADFFTVFVTRQFIGHFRCVSNKKQSFSDRLPVNYTVIKTDTNLATKENKCQNGQNDFRPKRENGENRRDLWSIKTFSADHFSSSAPV